MDASTIALKIASSRRIQSQGVGLVVTPNIDHVVQLRRNQALARAYQHAEIIVCDGFPVRYYAQMRGLQVKRVAGTDIAAELMRKAPPDQSARLFFVVDSEATQDAVYNWAKTRGLHGSVLTSVPKYGFERDAEFCSDLARQITGHGTTILMMGVGAPRSEIFVNTYRRSLPPCWALCVGQAIKIEVGLVRRAPLLVQRMHAEWLWRIMQEPRRLTGRYLKGGGLYLVAVLEDLLGRGSR
ncbi:WecB/TagA/CpsF family glycosyltransferase [Methylobacterium phyllosphaerae]